MLAPVLSWSCNALIACLLFRAARGRFFNKYIVFFLYLSHVLLLGPFRLYFFVFDPSSYRTFYWYTQFLSVAIGYCVVWEIYSQALADYPGVTRLARSVIGSIFVIVLAKALTGMLADPAWVLAKTVADLERNLRTVQAILLLIIVGLLSYYAIPIGRNLRGIILGYGFFVGSSVIYLTLLDYLGEPFYARGVYFPPVAYLVALLIWSVSLWSYHPNPRPEAQVEIEQDYEFLSNRTALAVEKAWDYVLREVRS